MWPFDRTKGDARRREARRSRTEQQSAQRARLLARVGVWPIVVAVGFGLGAALILNAGGEAMPYREGMSLPNGATARVSFEVVDEQATQIRRTQARDSSPAYFAVDELLINDLRGRLASAIRIAKTDAGDHAKLREEAAALSLPLDEPALAELERLAAQPESADFQGMIDSTVRRLLRQPMAEDSEVARRRTPAQAILITEEAQRVVPVAELMFNTGEAAEQNVQKVATETAQAFPSALRAGFASLIAATLKATAPGGSYRPIYRYDADRTLVAERRAEASVAPQTQKYPAESLIVRPGAIDEPELKLLAREHRAYVEQLSQQPVALQSWLAMLGRSLLALLVAAGIATYVGAEQTRAARRPARLAGVTAVVLGSLAMARYGFLSGTSLPAHFAVGPQALAAAILAIVLPARFAFTAAGALALLITMATLQGAGFVIMLLAVTAMMVTGLRNVRNRGKIVLVGGLAGVLAFGVTLAASLVNKQTFPYALWQGAWAGGGTLAAAFIVEGVLPFIERLFRLSTNVTLLEWCDANKPLLRMMAAKAPGTYNHSLLMGSMAEGAAEAIGGNGLLCRAGAYYHDIGKINKPHYFIENATPGASRHEGLSPAMSLLIIIAHVKDGIAMAREYNLPASLHPFIAEHHGTTLVQYFYHAANKKRRPDDPEVADTQFRYPGPKPQSRETAVVMMCDAVEGAVRSMTDPTPSRIETVVNEIIQKRLLDGQFDECDLNFRELATIEESLVKSLCGIYHGRIAYPSEQKTA